jgi:hypothetical protein
MIETGYIVSYNSQSPWGTGVGAAVPFVSLDVEEVWLAGQLGFVRTVTLNGTIPSGGTSQIAVIRDLFAANFKPFIAPNITMSGAMVQEVTFNSQNYIGKVDYAVTLKDYSGFVLSVSDPVDEVSFQEQQDGSIIVNHRVSALGISTSGNPSDAFANAKNFVLGRTGLSTVNAVTTSFITSGNKTNIYVVSQQENINRAAGTYGISEVFRYDPLRNVSNGVCRRFSTELVSGISEDYIQVNVNGTYQVGKDVFDSGLFAQTSQSELYALANAMFGGTLNPLPASFTVDADSITTNLYARTMTVRATFDNSQTTSFFDYDFETSKDFRNGITQISIKGAIVGSGRHVRRKYDSALAFFNATMGGYAGARTYVYNTAISALSSLGYATYGLNPQPKSLSINFNSGQGIITINSSFDDGPFVSGYTDFGWTVSADCGVNVFKPHPSANQNGSYLIQDLNILNRTSVILNGNFAFPPTGTFTKTDHTDVRAKLINLEGAINAFVESEGYNMSSGEAIKTGFNTTYSKDGCDLTNLPSDGKIYAGTRI